MLSGPCGPGHKKLFEGVIQLFTTLAFNLRNGTYIVGEGRTWLAPVFTAWPNPEVCLFS